MKQIKSGMRFCLECTISTLHSIEIDVYHNGIGETIDYYETCTKCGMTQIK